MLKSTVTIKKILIITTFILYLFGVLMGIAFNNVGLVLDCSYLLVVSIFTTFAINGYSILLGDENIIFMSKERYINLQLKEINDLSIKNLKKRKVEIKIVTSEEEFILYTNSCNLYEIKKILDKR